MSSTKSGQTVQRLADAVAEGLGVSLILVDANGTRLSISRVGDDLPSSLTDTSRLTDQDGWQSAEVAFPDNQIGTVYVRSDENSVDPSVAVGIFEQALSSTLYKD